MEKTSVYHIVNGDLALFVSHIENSKNDKGYYITLHRNFLTWLK